MSAKHALLGLLLNRPAYPYELANRLQTRLGPAWAINSGQVYQTIKKMEKEGLIEPVDGAAGGRPARHIFAITESGGEEFERWFETTTDGAQLTRRPLQVKITLGGPERLRDALEQIDAYERDCAGQLKTLSRMQEEQSPGAGPGVRADYVLLRLNLSADIIQLEGELRWARHAHEMVSWLLGREAIWPATPERSDASSVEDRDRHAARQQLFGRMAARHLRSTPDQPGAGDEQ
jgi:DNA-binding PadR family transcriptional regulator